jgi:hypothetical protein
MMKDGSVRMAHRVNPSYDVRRDFADSAYKKMPAEFSGHFSYYLAAERFRSLLKTW